MCSWGKRSVWVKQGLLVPSFVVLAACGTSRSTRSSNPCSTTQSIVDNKVAPGNKLENYDPTAVLLLFKATSDKIAIESRCNARLVNKLLTKHKLADGMLTDVVAPVDFSKLTLQLETGEGNLELHTSAHCFFRIWDSRVAQQLSNNPAISVEPARSLLANHEVRYQLYRSMLTTPQTIIGYLPDGRPVELKYKLQTTPIYERFFAEVDKQNSPELKKVVGQELSKSSVILDEFVTHECNSDDKVERRSFNPAVTSQVKDALSLLAFIQSNSKDKALLELGRTRTLASGRHKLCFSQTDMVVAPVQLIESNNEIQKTFVAEIEKKQKNKVEVYSNYLKNYREQYLNGDQSAASNDFIFKIRDGGASSPAPVPFPADLQKCSLASAYPGFLVSDAILQRLEKTYFPKMDYSSVDSASFAKPFTKLFPNLVVGQSEAALIRQEVEESFKVQQCRLVGRRYDLIGKKCDTVDPSVVGRCPAPGSDPAKIQASHEFVAKSIHISSASPIHMLNRFREESPLTLTIPFSVMRDYVQMSCNSASNGSCSPSAQAAELKKILDTIEPITITTSSGQTVAPTKAENFISVARTDADHQLICTREFNNSGEEQTSALFSAWPEESKKLVSEGLPAGTGIEQYKKVGTRHIYLKCTAAGLQRLYNSDTTFYGIGQYFKYIDISMVRTDAAEFNGKSEISNQQMIQSGQAVQIPFPRVFFNESQANESSTEVTARLLAGPHFQVSYCRAQQAKNPNGTYSDLSLCNDLDPITDLSKVGGELQKIPAHLNFTTQLPAWLPENKKAKYGLVAFPSMNYSADSGRYFFTAGDSGTTLSGFGLFPLMMLSTVQDVPVSGGLAVIPSKGEQQVQTSKGTTCR